MSCSHRSFTTKSILFRGGTLVTVNADDKVVKSDLLVRDGRIAVISEINKTADEIVDARRCGLPPSFVQTPSIYVRQFFAGRRTICPCLIG